MRRQAQGHTVRMITLTAAVTAGVATLLLSGCVRRPKPGLLGPRAVVPPPFVEPATTMPVTSIPPEPAFSAAPVVPTGMTLSEDLVFSPSEEEVKPPKAGSTRPAVYESVRMTYTVKKGDSLWLISQMYGVSVGELAAENGLRESGVLKVGQVLKLPPGASGRPKDPAEIKRAAAKRPASTPTPAASTRPKSTATAASAPKAPAASSARTATKEPLPTDGIYAVKSGDNPWTIARKFGVKHEDLLRWNGYTSSTVLQIGQKVKLRGDAVEGIAGPARPAVAVPPPAPAAIAPARTVLTEPAPLEAPVVMPPVVAPGTVVAPAGVGVDTPAAGAATAPLATPTTGAIDLPKKLSHTFIEGETLEIIAEMYGTTVEAIKAENPTIRGNADLLPNTKLMVPYR